jgi:nucleotide-binding universal stress UspA family protein
VAYRRLSPEGKNYRRIVEAAASGDHDVLMLGALGLGAVPVAVVGSVCERVVRRSPIDVLVIRDPGRTLGDGPLVVALDGSQRSFGALKTALDLGRRLGAPVHAVAAYDPYFHYVAFNKIAGVLSEEAGQTFRFKEQETLHEEIIDSGIAKIYQQHLEIARSVAEDEGVTLVCELLDGKPYQAIARYLEKVGASLLLLGKTGIHADPDLDIGGNAENLLRMAPCHIWLSQVTHTPPLEAVARETITWTEEAEQKMARVPETARKMVRMAILRMAQESGHTVVTSALIDEATNRFCPERGGSMDVEEPLSWSDEAARLLETVGDGCARRSVPGGLSQRMSCPNTCSPSSKTSRHRRRCGRPRPSHGSRAYRTWSAIRCVVVSRNMPVLSAPRRLLWRRWKRASRNRARSCNTACATAGTSPSGRERGCRDAR